MIDVCSEVSIDLLYSINSAIDPFKYDTTFPPEFLAPTVNLSKVKLPTSNVVL